MNKLVIIVCALILGGITIAQFSIAAAQAKFQHTDWYGNHLPFDLNRSEPEADTSKKVFAHYFLPYPVSINNQSDDRSYYQKHYLNPHGESDKFLNKGGLLRQRPLSRAPIHGAEHFRLTDLRHEIQMAKAIGIDGFAINILSLHGQLWQQTLRLLQVAEEQQFTILIMPDMNAQFKRHPEYIIPLLKYLNQYPNAHRLDDGRLVVAPYLAENQNPLWWADVIEQLDAEGVPVAFVPVFHNMTKQWHAYRQQLNSKKTQTVLTGISEWGPRSPQGADQLRSRLQQMSQENLLVMSPVAPQDMRPKSSIFTESHNSEAYRRMWESAISADVDWIHIITWNDYSESTEIAPSTETGYAFYDLTAYYISWFKQGKPNIERDALYAFYRKQPWQAVTTFPGLDKMNPRHGYAAQNEIELLGFLTAPGTLEIRIDDKVQRKEAEAGMVSFKIPMQSGRPTFSLIRDGQIVESIESNTEIRNSVEISNLLYRGEVSRRTPPQSEAIKISWPWPSNSPQKDILIRNLNEKSPFKPLTDFGAYALVDNSSKGNGGIGFSFLQQKTTSLHIQFDVKTTPLTTQNPDVVLSLLKDSKTPVEILSLLSKKDGGVCLMLNAKSDRCEETIPLNTWYRVKLTAQISPQKKSTASWTVSIRSHKGLVLEKQIPNLNTEISAISGLQFDNVGPGEIMSTLLIDNLSIKTGHQI